MAIISALRMMINNHSFVNLIVQYNLHSLRQGMLAILISLALYTHQSVADWVSPYYQDHPLVGKIYAPAKKSWVSQQEVSQDMQASDYLLLGETHSNPDHHIGQARLITAFSRLKSQAAIVFEMLELSGWPRSGQRWQELEPLLEQAQEKAPRWDWEIYQPILSAAVEQQLPIYAANLSREQLSVFGEPGACEHTFEGKTQRFCDTIKSPQYSAIKDLIFDAHCGYVPRDQLDTLVNMQIARDAYFAVNLSHAAEAAAPILITGAVHARKDIGVPLHLSSNAAVLSIAFIAVDPERETPEEYFSSDLGVQYDYIYFTPSERNVDPCVEFAEQLKKIKNHK